MGTVKLSTVVVGCTILWAGQALASGSGDGALETSATTNEAEATEAAEEKSEDKKTEATATTTSKTTSSSDDKKADKKKAASDDAVLLGPAAASGNANKPWRANVSLTQSVGSGSFVTGVRGDVDRNRGAAQVDVPAGAGRASYGWSLGFGGWYRVHPKLMITGGISMDQQVLQTSGDIFTKPNEFFLRELRLGVFSPGLYKESLTGIIFGVGSSLRLPTDKLSQAQGRLFGVTLGASMTRPVKGLGPGTLVLRYSLNSRVNATPQVQTIDHPSQVTICRSAALNSAGDACVTSNANVRGSLSNTLGMTYLWGKFYASSSITVISLFRTALNTSTLDGTGFEEDDLSSSAFADPSAANTLNLTSASVEIGYTATSFLTLALGTTTLANPFIFRGDNPRALRFPFWDFETPENNLSSIYFNVNVQY